MKTVLTINAGSSGLKASLFTNSQQSVVSYQIENMATDNGFVTIEHGGKKERIDRKFDSQSQAIEFVAKDIATKRPDIVIDIVAHRIVFSGPKLRRACWIKDETIDQLKTYVSVDPAHIPGALSLIEDTKRIFQDSKQAACFDSQFTADMPRQAKILPIPRKFYSLGVMRYGYHGLSYQYILDRLLLTEPDLSKARLVIAHLGSGSSVVGICQGKPVDASMGFTPNSGMIMSGRSGDIDPGLMAYLANHQDLSAAEIARVLNAEGGLKGISDLTADMEILLQQQHVNQHAAEAVEAYVRSAAKAIAAMLTVTNGLDMLVFTGGIGERSAEIRARIVEKLNHLGLDINPTKNSAAGSEECISTDNSPKILVMHTQEEVTMVNQVRGLV